VKARLRPLSAPPASPSSSSSASALGHTLASVCAELKQKRGTFIVAEPLAAIPEWHRAHLPESPLLTDDRVVLENDCSPPALTRHAGMLHAILLHLDASPTGPRNRPWVDDRRWLSASFEALQAGGLLAIAGSRYAPSLTRNLQRSGFEVAEFTVPAAPGAKKPRFLPIWLARKGRAADG
jgi:hypothetical protein